MRIVLADPPAFTPAYDHELAAALARAGADVELVTSHFRFGAAPAPDGYVRRELFYPVSSKLFRRSRLRVPLKVAEHPLGLAALRFRPADVLHVQWLVPEIDARLFRPHAPAVFTAHDLLPRRTATKQELWRSLLSRFDRVVVHSEHGREALAPLGVDARVIPHPVFPSDPERAGRRAHGALLRRHPPYKGLGDAIEAVRACRVARLLVAGDPLEPVDAYRRAAAGLDVEWRLGYLDAPEVDRALGDATVALFPYRPELDQSGALLRALGAGVPADRVRRRRDRGARAAIRRRTRRRSRRRRRARSGGRRSCSRDPAALEEARAGARRARAELTWDAAARAHLALYEELV